MSNTSLSSRQKEREKRMELLSSETSHGWRTQKEVSQEENPRNEMNDDGQHFPDIILRIYCHSNPVRWALHTAVLKTIRLPSKLLRTTNSCSRQANFKFLCINLDHDEDSANTVQVPHKILLTFPLVIQWLVDWHIPFPGTTLRH